MDRGLSILLTGVMLLLAGCDWDPFADPPVQKVPDDQSQSVDLLAPGRNLPKSATNIFVHERHFQDTSLHVKFEAPLADAEAFMRRTVGKNAKNCGGWSFAPMFNDWPKKWPAGGQCIEDMTFDDPSNGPAIEIAIIPNGATATVLVHTFTT